MDCRLDLTSGFPLKLQHICNYTETMAGDEEQRRSQEAATQPTQHHRADDVGPSTDAGPAATAQGGPAATAQGGPTEEDEPILHLRRRQHLLDLRIDIMEIRMEQELRRAHRAIDIMSDLMEMRETKKRKGPPSEMEEHGTHGGSCGGSSGSRGGGRGGGAVPCRPVCRVQRRHT